MTQGQDIKSNFWRSVEQRIQIEWVLVTAVMLALTAVLSYCGSTLGLARFDRTFYDRVVTASAQHADASDIVIVAIDENSIAELGYWPWRRAVHARLIDRLRSARVVAFDIIFSDANPAYPDDDDALARAIARNGKVVLPTVVQHGGRGMTLPLTQLARRAAGLGYINIYPDEDGVVRSVTLRQTVSTIGAPTDHFLLAILAVAKTLQAPSPSVGQESLIPFGRLPNRFVVHPYARVLDGTVPESALRDKYVLVGSWTTGMGDMFATPLSGTSTGTPGIEILANGLQAAIADEWIRTPNRWVSVLWACLPVLLACLAFRRLSPRWSFVAATLVLILSFAGACALLRFFNVWIPFSATLIGVVLSLPLWIWRSQEASLQHIDAELDALKRDSSDFGNTFTAAGSKDALPSARVTQLHSAVLQLREVSVRREETLRFLSHDMRAPQNSILALTHLQRDTKTAIDPDDFLQQLDSYAYKTLALADGFVHLARASAIQIVFQTVQLVDLIEEALDQFWSQARVRNIELRFCSHPHQAEALGDASLLLRAISNLVDNALKYSPSDTVVECKLVKTRGFWRISVHDQGCGFTAEQASTLFEPFMRVDNQRDGSAPGVGLGLAFVSTVIERHGGSVYAISDDAGGAEVTLLLPVID